MRDLGGPIFHLNPEHLVHIHLGKYNAHQLPGIIPTIAAPQRFQFQPPQFPVSHHKKIAAAA
ncbi:MAG: hypothetical protein LW837_26990, partial [Roseomonas sp.]|nr:hypothetical protein [Roseomonas sp.]